MHESFDQMETKPRAADGLFHLLLLWADTPTLSGGWTKMDDPKHIGPHDGIFEQEQQQKITFCILFGSS